jgi:hypothetical protein
MTQMSDVLCSVTLSGTLGEDMNASYDYMYVDNVASLRYHACCCVLNASSTRLIKLFPIIGLKAIHLLCVRLSGLDPALDAATKCQ